MGTLIWDNEPRFIDERAADDSTLGRVVTGEADRVYVTINGIGYHGSISAHRSPYDPERVYWEHRSVFRNDGLITNHLTDAAASALVADLTQRFPAEQIATPLTMAQEEASAADQVKQYALGEVNRMMAQCESWLRHRNLPLHRDTANEIIRDTIHTHTAH